jgi:hypothetical protein
MFHVELAELRSAGPLDFAQGKQARAPVPTWAVAQRFSMSGLRGEIRSGGQLQPQRLKPPLIFSALAARLKPSSFKANARVRVFAGKFSASYKKPRLLLTQYEKTLLLLAQEDDLAGDLGVLNQFVGTCGFA